MSPPSDRRAIAATGALCWVAFARLLLWSPSLLWRDVLGGLFDAQSVALRQGHLDIRDGSLGFEAFQMGRLSHSYFGLVPSLARMPILWIAPSLRGELTRPSMLLGFAVLMVALGRLLAEALRRVGSDRLGGWTRPFVIITAFIAAVCAGPMFLASRAWVYHEATLWSLAFGTLALDLLLRAVHRIDEPAGEPGSGAEPENEPDTTEPAASGTAVAPLLWLGSAGAAAIAMHCRFPVGLGAAVGVGATTLWYLTRRSSRLAAGVFIVLAVGLGAYAAVNHARFDSWFGVPVERQIIARTPQFTEALARNGGTLFGVRYLPSTVWAIARPTGIGLRSSFPGLGLPAERFDAIGGVTLGSNERTASLTAMSPLAALFAALGAAVALRRGLRRGPERRPAELFCMIGAAGGAAGVLLIGYVATRYSADLFPLVAIGLATCLSAVDLSRFSPRLARVGLACVAVALAWTVLATVGVSMQYQRELGIGVSDEAMASWLRTQDRLGPVDTHSAANATHAPDPKLGSVLIIGRCDALYRANGDTWRQIEARPAGGRLQVTTVGPTVGGRAAVIATTTGARRVEFLKRNAAKGRVQLGLAVMPDTTGSGVEDAPATITWSQPIDRSTLPRIELGVDPVSGFHTVRVDDEIVASVLDSSPATGTGPVTWHTTGLIRTVTRTKPTPTCDALRG